MVFRSPSHQGLALAVAVTLSALLLAPAAQVHADGDEDEPDEVEVSLGFWRQPGGPCDAAWREEFMTVQGRTPEDEDCLDRVWSVRFVQTRGAEPTTGDWERRLRKTDPVDEDPDPD